MLKPSCCRTVFGGFRYAYHARIKIISVSTAFDTVPPNEHTKVQEILVFRDTVGNPVVAEMLNSLLRIIETIDSQMHQWRKA
jgi:hypothetical protein